MLNKTWIVYSLINNVTGERYIGMTSQSLKKRFRNGRGYKGYTQIKQAIDIYGWDNFSYEVLAKTDSVEKAEELEKYYIVKYDTIKHGYNKQSGGLKATSYEITELHRQHMRDAQLGSHHSPKTEFKKGELSMAHITRMKPVYCVNNGKMYINSIVAGKELNIPARSIRRVCSGERTHTHGYMFISVEVNEVIDNE